MEPGIMLSEDDLKLLIHTACTNGQPEVLTQIIKDMDPIRRQMILSQEYGEWRQLPVESVFDYGPTTSRHLECLRILLENGASQRRLSVGNTDIAMHLAVHDMEIEGMELLLQADPMAIFVPDCSGYSPFHFVAFLRPVGNFIDSLLTVISKYFSISDRDRLMRMPCLNGDTVLHLVCYNGEAKILERLLQIGSRWGMDILDWIETGSSNKQSAIIRATEIFSDQPPDLSSSPPTSELYQCTRCIATLKAIGAETKFPDLTDRVQECLNPSISEEFILAVRKRIYFSDSLVDRLIIAI